MGLLNRMKDVTVSSSAEARQAFGRGACSGADARGGLLGRLAGARKGGAVDQTQAGANAGSSRFQAMVAAQTQSAMSGSNGGDFGTSDGNNGVW